MIRKATAKSAEANAAVRRRSTGLDQRFKMSASVAGLPSIYIAGVPELFCRSVGARGEHSEVLKVLQLLQIFIAACTGLCFASMSTELYFSQLASPFTLPFEPLQPQELFAKLAACDTLACSSTRARAATKHCNTDTPRAALHP